MKLEHQDGDAMARKGVLLWAIIYDVDKRSTSLPVFFVIFRRCGL